MTDEVAESPSETEEQGTLDWIWGMLEGDFNENPTVGQIIANAAITAIPLVDQAADARDLVANLKALIWDKRYNEVAVWLGLFFTLIGLIPSLGSLLKGVLKLVYRGAKLDAVFKVFNALAKGNAWEWLQKLRAGELRKHADDAARMMKQIMDNIIDTLNEALSYVPRWADDLYGKISDLIAEIRVIRGKIEEMFGQITKDLEAKLDDLLAKQEKNQVEGGSRQTLVKKQEAETTHESKDSSAGSPVAKAFRQGDIESAPQYVKLTSAFKGMSSGSVKQFYRDLEAKGINYMSLIENGISNHGLTPDEAHAVFGYTTKLFYRDLNQTLDAGGSIQAKELTALIKSGLDKMPKSSNTQYRGIRLADSASVKQFDAKYSLGNTVESAFWSTAPDKADAYSGARNLTIKTDSARDISDLAFGVHFHDNIGKQTYSSETIIPPGIKFKIIDTDGKGNLVLEQD